MNSRITLVASVLLGLVFNSAPAFAQVVLDGSVGTGSLGDLVAADPMDATITYDITQDLGDTLGDNLFHSFDMFDVNNNEIARFSGLASIRNIIGRITGGTISTIDGTVRSSIVGADVWLINPTGFVFGANAVLDTTGSFHAGAADYIQFFDGRYGADLADPANTMLTSAPPSAFGFVGARTGVVDLNNANLSVEQGESISLVGLDVLLDSSLVTAPGGQITLDGSGTVSMVNNSVLDVSDTGAGSVFIRGGEFLMGPNDTDDERILATSSDADGGVVDIDVTGDLVMRGEIRSNTSGSGNAADILINAASFTLTQANTGISGSVIDTSTDGSGDAGSLSISTSGGMYVYGRTDTSTSAAGSAGDISLTSDLGTIDLFFAELNSRSGAGTGNAGSQTTTAGLDILTTSNTQFSANAGGTSNAGAVSLAAGRDIDFDGSINTQTTGAGAGGNILLSATGDLDIGGGFITSRTFGDGNAGNITLTASTINIAPPLDNNPIAINADTSGAGRGGDISITADRLSVTDNQITASTSRSGDGGVIFIQIDGIADGVGLELNNATIQASALRAASGDAGTITIFGFDANNPGEVIDMQLSNNSRIVANTTTEATGSAGGVEIQTTGALRVFGDSLIGSFSEVPDVVAEPSCPPGPPCAPPIPIGGLPGSVTIVADALYLGLDETGNLNGSGQILASTESNGVDGRSAGLVTIIIGTEIEIAGAGSQISTTTSGQDTAAGIFITGGNLMLRDGGVITASTTGDGDAGVIEINDVGTLTVDGTSSIDGTTTAGGDGGGINIDGAAIVIINGAVSTSTSGSGNGGRILLTNLDTLTVAAGGIIESMSDGPVFDTGIAGDITIDSAGSVQIDGEVNTGTRTNSNAGTMTFNDIDTVTISGTVTSSSVFNTGSAGNVNISNIDSVVVDATGTIASTTEEGEGDSGFITFDTVGDAVISGEVTTSTRGTGAAGDIRFLNVADLTIDADGRVLSTNGGTSTGAAGNVEIDSASNVQIAGLVSTSTGSLNDAGTISITDVASVEITGLVESSSSWSGSAGDILLTGVDNLMIDNGTVRTDTSGSGTGGVIRLGATNVTVTDSGLVSAVTFADGFGGDVYVDATHLLVESGGAIVADTTGSGTGGSITLGDQAAIANVTVTGMDSRISANTFADGAGGNINVAATDLLVESGGRIVADAIGSGMGGSITIGDLAAVTSVMITGTDSRISANTFAGGTGGSIVITADSMVLQNGGAVSVNASATGTAGQVSLTVAERLDIVDGASVNAGSLSSGGGVINIDVGDFIFLSESEITARTDSNTEPGGTINIGQTLAPIFFIIVDSRIIANVDPRNPSPNAGTINLDADNLFIDEKSTIEATNELNINSNIADMTATIVVVEEPYLNVLHLLEDRCAATAIQDRSSFVIEGIFGLQPAPDSYSASPISKPGQVESTSQLRGPDAAMIDAGKLNELAEAVGC